MDNALAPRIGEEAKAHMLDPAMAPFYACVAIAFLAVGLMTCTVGRSLIGDRRDSCAHAGRADQSLF